MEFNILFALAASLSFTIEYSIDSNTKQDLFIFKGEKEMAHLFRENKTLSLYIQSNSSFELYQISIVGKQFNFTWDGFKVNNKRMKMVKSSGKISELHFNGYTFLCPYIDVMLSTVEDSQLETVYHNAETNYGLIMLIVLSIGVLLKTDIIAQKVWKNFIRNTGTSETTDECSYVEIQV